MLFRPSAITAARPAARIITARNFQTSPAHALKESDRDQPGQAGLNEKHKQDSLEKSKDGKGHWKPELASDSEEAVNADRSHKGESTEELQKRTVEHAEKKHKHGTSQDPGL